MQFLGKQLATFTDVRFARGQVSSAVLEQLLTLTGGDEQSINRKGKSFWQAGLSTRILIASNQLPQFDDASGAIVSRMIVLPMPNSFYGREDPGLGDRLTAELPSILPWALEGLRRLTERGRFVQPKAGQDELRTMEDLASPVQAFARDRLVEDPQARVDKATLRGAYNAWLRLRGMPEVSEAQLTTHLKAAGLRFRSVRLRDGDRQPYFYAGLGLRPDDEAELCEAF